MALKDPDARREYNRMYREEHQGWVRGLDRKRYAEHPEKQRAATLRYLEQHGEEVRERARERYRKLKIVIPWVNSYRNAWKRCNDLNHDSYKNYGGKGVQFLLTKEHMEVLWLRDNADQLGRPSIDRIDSNGDYDFDNCRFIELSENSRGGR